MKASIVMKFINLFSPYIASIFFISAGYAADAVENTVDHQLDFIERTYQLSPSNYAEDLRAYHMMIEQVLSQTMPNLGDKKLGVVVSENHEAEGAKCFEILLLPLVQSFGIQDACVELTPEKMELVRTKGYRLGSQIGFLQKLLLDTTRLKLTVHPIDIDIEKEAVDHLEDGQKGLEEIKIAYLTGRDRENLSFVPRIFDLNKSFIFYTGANHASSLYYDKALNERYHLIFINCGFPPSAQQKDLLSRVIDQIADPDVSSIHEQRERFLTETTRYYSMPIMYDQQKSMIYRMLASNLGHIPNGINADEVRGYHDAQEEIETDTTK